MALAPTTAEVVRYAGGWMFDRVMAGWDVTVLVADHVDTRPLDILGVCDVVDLEWALASGARNPLPQAIAIDAELCASDARVREGMLELFELGLVDEVTLWGEGWSPEFDRHIGRVQHQLSVAARAFKTQALTAASAAIGPAVTTELFRSCELRPRDQVCSDLIPA